MVKFLCVCEGYVRRGVKIGLKTSLLICKGYLAVALCVLHFVCSIFFNTSVVCVWVCEGYVPRGVRYCVIGPLGPIPALTNRPL